MVKKNNKVSHIITESKSGREAWAGNMFIDCTGDGDLAASAGCEFDFGDKETGLTQPFTLLAIIAGVKYDKIKPSIMKYVLCFLFIHHIKNLKNKIYTFHHIQE